jgi:hypothetical protein
MRKVESGNENPVDNVIISFCEMMNPALIKLGITPNMVTFVGFLLCIGAMQALWVGDVYKFGTLFLLTYYTDCQDGSLARSSNACTWFGDLADHIRDTFMVIGVASIILIKYQPSVLQTIPILFMFIMSLVNFGCQQKMYHDNEGRPSTCQEEESLSKLIYLCPDTFNTTFTKFFGSGTFVVLIIIWVLYLDSH